MLNNFEQYLTHALDECPDGIVKEAALYSLLAGGKRVRPRLLFAVLEAYRNSASKGIDCACAIEMIHTYSLIHDDLPSMDNDTLRRGKPTCHVKYGEGNAILAGDALLTHSFNCALKSSIPPQQQLQIIRELSQASGLSGMIYGQEMDIHNEEENVETNIHTLEKTHRYKTGMLIALPLVCGCIIAGKSDDSETWREIGYQIGLLFQIQDDLMDVTKTSEQLGKNANSDMENHKTTYITLLKEDGCREKIDALYESILTMVETLNIDKQPILAILDYLLNREN